MICPSCGQRFMVGHWKKRVRCPFCRSLTINKRRSIGYKYLWEKN